MRVLFITLALPLALLSTGCAPANDDGARVEPNYPEGTFEYKPGEGSKARFENLGQEDIISGVFAKRYNRADLNAVLEASANSTVEYVKQMGVELYRAPRPSEYKREVFFWMLDKPPDDVYELWKMVSAGIKKGVLAGIYTDYCSSSLGSACTPDRVARPVIVIDESSERWTLVHEMMHFAFDRQRRNDHVPNVTDTDRKRRETLSNLMTYLQGFDPASSRDVRGLQLARIVGAYQELVNLVVLRIVNKELEEEAVEYTLLEKYLDQSLKFVPKLSSVNAVWYMSISREAATEIMESTDSIGRSIINLADTESDSLALARVKSARAELQNVNLLSKQILDDAKSRVSSPFNQTGFDLMASAAAGLLPSPVAAAGDLPPPLLECMENREGHDQLLNELAKLAAEAESAASAR